MSRPNPGRTFKRMGSSSFMSDNVFKGFFAKKIKMKRGLLILIRFNRREMVQGNGRTKVQKSRAAWGRPAVA
jgi:hypothetical protein